MAKLGGWKTHDDTNLAGTVATDVAVGIALKWTDAAAKTMEICGAGEVPCGVNLIAIDVSEDGGRATVVRGPSVAVVPCAAAITDDLIPVKVAADGKCTPCDTDKDVILGMPLNEQATTGGDVEVDLTLMGAFYTV